MLESGAIVGATGDHASDFATARATTSRPPAGVLKVMSKMGISTVPSYNGAQLFQVIGLNQETCDEFFTGCVSQLDGIGLDELADEVAARHHLAFLSRPSDVGAPRAGGRRRVPVAS